jgi:expansin (peptidoglycan-binding protein)
VPITNVEVQSEKHASFFTLARVNDGTVFDAGGFGNGEFTLRVTGMDGQIVTETLASFSDGALVSGSAQFE